jgi:hypothetical protein
MGSGQSRQNCRLYQGQVVFDVGGFAMREGITMTAFKSGETVISCLYMPPAVEAPCAPAV